MVSSPTKTSFIYPTRAVGSVESVGSSKVTLSAPPIGTLRRLPVNNLNLLIIFLSPKKSNGT